MPNPQQPEGDADWLDKPPTLTEAIEDLRGLIDDFDDVRPDDMTVHFYIHAFNMLIETGRDLVRALDNAGVSDRGTGSWP